MKLGTKLIISFTGIVLIALAIVLVLVIDSSFRTYKERIGTDLQNVAKLISEDIDYYLDGMVTDVGIYSDAYVFRTGTVKDIDEYMMRTIREVSPYEDIYVTDNEGKVIAATNQKLMGKALLGGSGGEKEVFTKAKADGKPYVSFSEIPVAEANSKLAALVVSPVRGAGGMSSGRFVAASVRMGEMMKSLYNMQQQNTRGGLAYLLNDPGEIVLTRDGKVSIFVPVTYVQHQPRFKGFLAGDTSGHEIFKDYKGDKVLVGFVDLSKYGIGQRGDWAVVSFVLQKDIFGPAESLRNKIIVVGLVALAVAWFLGFIVSRGITRPLRRLVNVTDLISGGDLSQRADIKLNDEVGDLARSFNKMTNNLNDAIVARDQEIIERKNVEEELNEEMDTKTKFIAMISDEIKTPLASIKQGIGLALDQVSDKIDDQPREMLSYAARSVGNLTGLLKDIVDFYQMETNRTEFTPAKNDINEIILDVKKDMLPLLAEKRDLEFVIDTEDDLPGAVFDGEKISLVLTNIVNMAINLANKGTITVKTAREGDNAIRVSVTDTSAEIEKEALSKLFHQFDETGKKRDREAGGTGLGLAISRAIIEMHRGKIWAESVQGGGTAFCFVLPLSERRK